MEEAEGGQVRQGSVKTLRLAQYLSTSRVTARPLSEAAVLETVEADRKMREAEIARTVAKPGLAVDSKVADNKDRHQTVGRKQLRLQIAGKVALGTVIVKTWDPVKLSVKALRFLIDAEEDLGEVQGTRAHSKGLDPKNRLACNLSSRSQRDASWPPEAKSTMVHLKTEAKTGSREAEDQGAEVVVIATNRSQEEVLEAIEEEEIKFRS